MSSHYIDLNLDQGTDRWLAERARLDRFNASKTGVLYDVDPYTTRLQYAEEKIHKIKQSTKGKERLFEAGHKVEIEGRKYANENLGFNFKPAVLLSNYVMGLLASLDGIDEKAGAVLENKYTGLENLKKINNGDLPPHHVFQVQAQLLTTGFDRCVYMATHKEHFVTKDIEPDKELHRRLADDIQEFLAACARGELPEPSDRDYHEPTDERFHDLLYWKEVMDGATKRFDELKSQLSEEFKLYARIRYQQLTMVRSTRKGNINYGKIAELQGVDLEKYRGAPISSVTVKLGKSKI